MTITPTRPAYDADERTQLVGWLDMQRDIIRWKCQGVSEDDAHRPVLPGSPLMTLAGIVSHLRWVEHCWFQILLNNESPAKNPQFDEALPEDADMRVEGIPLAQLLEEYERECESSNETMAAFALDDIGKNRDYKSGSASLRWVLFHMIEETARHAGHMDAIRELVDGTKGYF
ncbi:Protein of unknown function [Actinokineospora alba]|uniref:DinB superfamily protein n=1 Tax=Actinokineospora alba TaxID=504798 RepID=A0A1H0V0D9_9PSEU|nr:DinB family protein [Actinokineospora alba]TDP68940.1 uncharacterized protein DUF664 [Actinokineospora alba]SDI75670.1 Protein of unknown function [Actinokineospora alba]SDP71920.1 Protein of unknown function [Actinokineospora alba]